MRLFKRLSRALRHDPGALDLRMDEAGWVPIEGVLGALGLELADLRLIARLDPKSRMQFDGESVRACQGHSFEGTPVTLEALEASWERVAADSCESLFHGTSLEAWGSIAQGGIHAAKRTHVHLAADRESVVGKRAGVEVLLEVDSRALIDAGSSIFRAPNGVLLTRGVPASCIVAVHPQSKRARSVMGAGDAGH